MATKNQKLLLGVGVVGGALLLLPKGQAQKSTGGSGGGVGILTPLTSGFTETKPAVGGTTSNIYNIESPDLGLPEGTPLADTKKAVATSSPTGAVRIQRSSGGGGSYYSVKSDSSPKQMVEAINFVGNQPKDTSGGESGKPIIATPTKKQTTTPKSGGGFFSRIGGLFR